MKLTVLFCSLSFSLSIFLQVEWQDFMRAMDETVPAFGNKDNEELRSHFSNKICHYGPAFEETYSTMLKLFNQTRTSVRTPLLSVMLEGEKRKMFC